MKYLRFVFTLFSISIAYAQTDRDYSVAEELYAKAEFKAAIPYYEKYLKTKPNHENSLRSVGKAYLNIGNYDKASYYYRKALKVNPKCDRCYIHLAIVNFHKERYDSVLIHLDKALLLNNKDPENQIIRGHCFEAQKDYISALTAYDKAVALDTGREALIARAQYYFKKKYYSFAKSDLFKILQKDSTSFMIYDNLSTAYIMENSFEEALKYNTKAIKLNDSLSSLYTTRGSLYFSLQDTTKAMQNYWKAAKMKKPDLSAWIYLNDYYYDKEDMDSSCVCIKNAEALIPSFPDINQETISYIENKKSNHCDSTLPSYYYQRGLACYNLHQGEQSVMWHQKGIDKFPKNVLMYHFLGNSLMAIGKYAEALDAYKKHISNREQLIQDIEAAPMFADRNLSADYQYEGYFYSTQLFMTECNLYLGQPQEALQHADHALKYDFAPHKPSMYAALVARACAYIQLKNYDKGLEDLNRCINDMPSYPAPYKNRAILKLNKAQLLTYSVSTYGISQNQSLLGEISMVTTKAKKMVSVYESAYGDIEKYIKLNNSDASAYYIRGIIKYNLEFGDYCYDFILAHNKGYKLPDDIEKLCKK